MKPLYRERDGVCSRGWLFLGEQGGPCDQKCEMCYYAWQKNLVFYDLRTLFQHANLFRHYYGLDACDITGGEATVYPPKNGGIVALVRHCAKIGLRPTIITHGQNNHNEFRLGYKRPLWQEIEDAGLDDWLVSLHGGSAESHDRVLGKDGSFDRLMTGIHTVKRPVRFNTTLLEHNYKDLPTEVLLRRPPTVWNCINFNPFHAWAGEKKHAIDFQVRYTEAAPYISRAIELLEAAGWECNVRYFPLCIAKEHGFEANVSNYHQVPFDPWEWRLSVTHRLSMWAIEKTGGWYATERKMAAAIVENRRNPVCDSCALSKVCDPPTPQYQERFGLEELKPVRGEKRDNPLLFQDQRGFACPTPLQKSSAL